MFKQVSMMKRKPGMSMEDFIEQYEGRHAKFGEKLFPKARRLVRRYVQPEKNPLTGETLELDFDVILEIWWDSREDFAEAMKSIASSGLMGAVKESGEQLFASQNIAAFSVLEYDSKVERPL